MKKNAFIISIISFCLIMGTFNLGFAGDKPPPPPKGGGNCSPGFWKNHTELWFDVCCYGAECQLLEDNLRARGPGSHFLRDGAAAFLNSCIPDAPCDEND